MDDRTELAIRTSRDIEALMLDLGRCISALDSVTMNAPQLELEHVRRELVNIYLDVLTARLKPYDQALERETPRAPE